MLSRQTSLLFEGDVIDLVCVELERHGYQILSKASTTERGDDIVARKQGPESTLLYVEAKGATSSKATTKRFGKPFTSGQVRVHVAEALFKAAAVLSRPHKEGVARVALAFPDTRLHRGYAETIRPILNRLEVALFWAQNPGSVQFESAWQL